MIDKLNVVTILVRDQEEALRFYTDKLGFDKRSDEMFGPGVRWLTVAPPGQQEVEIVLQKPEPAMHGEEQAEAMMAQVGKMPTWSFATDDCRAAYETLSSRGVNFVQAPEERPYGIEALFEDLYGNVFSLLEQKEEA